MTLFKPTVPLLPVTPVKSTAKKSGSKSAGGTAKSLQTPENKIAGKKMPTPKRKDAQALNQRPIIIKDRKLARKRAREIQARDRNMEYEAMKTGDINKMPLKDRGEEKLFIRNYVDSRFHLSQLFIPIAFTLVAAMFTPLQNYRTLTSIILIVVYGYMLACGVEIFFRWRAMKVSMKKHFGPNLVFRGQGYINYMFIRMLQFPKMRLPKVLPKGQIAQMMGRKHG